MLKELTRVHCVVKGLFDSKCWGTSNIGKSHLSLLLLDQVCEQFIYPVLLWIYVIKSNSKVGPSYLRIFFLRMVVFWLVWWYRTHLARMALSLVSWLPPWIIGITRQTCQIYHNMILFNHLFFIYQILLYSLNVGMLTYRP